ncbi:MAG: group II intron reverse transcriptase/maturase [Bacteroidota bacterium]
MEGRMQKILRDKNYPSKDRTESERQVGVQTFLWITKNSLTNTNQSLVGLLEQILSPDNLSLAYQQVQRNKGSGGIDGMQVTDLHGYLIKYGEALIFRLLSGKYIPNPVLRVEIPKDNKGKRQLGIPTVIDRVIQQSISQILTQIYDPCFSTYSYGFRPKRNAHQALKQCQDFISSGYSYIVDLDLSKFFDTVSHCKLIEVLSRKVKDGRVLSLIHKYLNAGVYVGGDYKSSELGVPQGGPLSPLLGNIMLNELDKELEMRGHKFVRYADDLVIFCKSKRSSERVMKSITKFIEGKLYLKVNKEKSQVAPFYGVKFLGYSFYKNHKREVRLRIHPKSVSKMKSKIKLLTSRSNGWGTAKRKESLRQYIVGWVNYFKLADMQKLLSRVDEWYRRRIRMIIWKHWKRIRTKVRNLVKLGVKKSKAFEWANTRKSYWHIANSFILKTTITKTLLRKAGYLFLSDYYQKVRVKT